MDRISVKTGKSYDIIIEEGFGGLGEYVQSLFCGRSLFVITDENVGQLYLNQLEQAVTGICKSLFTLTLTPGENSKNLESLSLVYNFLLDNGADRKSVVVALGGGVIGDIAGFAAATYMRGVPYVQLPTSLLAQVDSSIGGKTAIDFGGYKNVVGSFYQPDFVYVNSDTLKTLPKRQFSNGMAEVLKYGLILDKQFMDYLSDNIENLDDHSVLTHIISVCARLKASVVEKDERDTGLRELLNFGHTIGHAVETLKNFELLHGECVALGTIAAMEISIERGMISEGAVEKYRRLIRSLGLPENVSGISPFEIFEATKKDKKTKSGQLSFVLLDDIGRAGSYNDVSQAEIMRAIEKITKEV